MAVHLARMKRDGFGRIGQKRALTSQSQKALLEMKSAPCADCGACYPPEVMEFDHVPGRGGKLHNISTLKTLRAILAEAEKCELVCANCHRVRTTRRRLDRQNERRARDRQVSAIGRED